jgi:tripartite-type tricarboxylate transporter receptor subunit TctC
MTFRPFVSRLSRETARILGMVALGAVIPTAVAAGYPDRLVRLIVPSLPGGGSDTTMRLIAPKLAEYLGQQTVVVENRAGVSGNLGAELVARAAPDGYTLLSIFASHTSNVAVMKNVPFDLVRDFAPISLAVTLPNVLVSHPSLPPKTVKELIAFAKARPGQLQYATAGVGSNAHLTMALFLNMTGLQMLHIPYKSSPQGIVDVIAGHVPLMVANILVAVPQIRGGRMRAYGVTSAARSSAAPELPTIAEMGLPGYEAVQWYSLVAPAGTPREIVTRLHAGVVRALHDTAIRKRLIDDGAEPAPSATPEEFGAFIKAEIAKWAKVVKAAGIQPE